MHPDSVAGKVINGQYLPLQEHCVQHRVFQPISDALQHLHELSMLYGSHPTSPNLDIRPCHVHNI